MTKLPEDKKFIDFSDYARPFAVKLVEFLLPTKIGAYSITFSFLVIGLLASYLIFVRQFMIYAAILILVKSLLDAADGEIARQRNQLSMVGRYLDSIFDFIVNVALILSIAHGLDSNLIIVSSTIILFHLQGSIFNYYYLIKRYQVNGDQTSRIFERDEPLPYERDNPKVLKILHKLYLIIYAWQDYIIFKLDKKAIETKELPGWFLSLVSLLGLGFQLLIISVFIFLNIYENTLFWFLIPHTILAILIILIRKIFVR
ncbi:MAG: CDP-alcohol phosphatidyltransferase family protein [Ignavibacteriales bacterium]|nr:CDP-alcohol phosphatidyltransferase family protein [Ignavibacteriales bacterium]